MRQITINIYQFEELTEEGQKKALEYFRDINTDCWWEHIYETAEEIGVEVNEFNLYPIKIRTKIKDLEETANSIIKNWGVSSAIYHIAEKYLIGIKEIVSAYPDKDKDQAIFEHGEEIDNKFIWDLEKIILSFLEDEYEWRTSDEAVTESIIANGYEFWETGACYEPNNYLIF